jgi:hypothetical protein
VKKFALKQVNTLSTLSYLGGCIGRTIRQSLLGLLPGYFGSRSLSCLWQIFGARRFKFEGSKAQKCAVFVTDIE